MCIPLQLPVVHVSRSARSFSMLGMTDLHVRDHLCEAPESATNGGPPREWVTYHRSAQPARTGGRGKFCCRSVRTRGLRPAGAAGRTSHAVGGRRVSTGSSCHGSCGDGRGGRWAVSRLGGGESGRGADLLRWPFRRWKTGWCGQWETLGGGMEEEGGLCRFAIWCWGRVTGRGPVD